MRGLAGCWLLLLAACATQPPAPARLNLQLPPAELGASIAVQQHLTVARQGKLDELDAALEIDGTQLQLVGLAFGQRVLSLHYDGKKLTEWRHPMLPQQVQAEAVLEDIQLTLWPLQSIRDALPADWRIEDREWQRALYLNNQLIYLIDYSSMPRWSGTVKLQNLRYHYSLTIQSATN